MRLVDVVPELSPYSVPAPALSDLELGIVRLVVAGLTLQEAAVELSYSYVYVRRVDARLRHRLGVRTRAQLAAVAVARGLAAA